MPRKEQIAIGIPSIDGSIPLGLADWLMLMATSNADSSCPCIFGLIHARNKQPYEYARNWIVTRFLETTADRLWFVDADMIPRVNSGGLVTVDADIAVGAYAKISNPDNEGIALSWLLMERTGNPHPLPEFRTMNPETEEAFPIDAGGTGCMIIRRHVLEDRRMWYPSEFTDARGNLRNHEEEKGRNPDWAVPIFRTHRDPAGYSTRGEDIDFCVRAQALGYSLKGHLGFGMDHQKVTTADVLAKTIVKERRVGAASARQEVPIASP